MTIHEATQSTRRALAICWIVRIVALYVILGATLKLFYGTPEDLPIVVRGILRHNPVALMLLVVGFELLLGLTALISPRLGWPALMALMGAFVVVLTVGLTQGEAACGCFGSAAAIPAWVMLTIDGALLCLLAAVRPWGALSAAPTRLWAPALAMIAIVPALWYLHASLTGTPDEPDAPAVVKGTPPSDVRNGAELEDPASTPVQARPPRAWRPPAVLPRYVQLTPERWIGRSVRQTALGTWSDPALYPDDCQIVLYMDTCPHCAEHLRELIQSPPSKSLVLVRVPNPPTAAYPIVVNEWPEGIRVSLHEGLKWGVRVPWDLMVEEGTINDAVYHGE